ncbi:2-C-methyl-D-erythritol 2,4-cyclodiphosphate synthase [Neisseria leonii]|uniref:2-C-methyl-D-erythritol 2,4-cyclodiphosphate synthase n=1 Tax=Neisseria leonii TaxID=2995413 RepID=UPI00237C2B15|nr:2-C-methyl-D-erythritol 2,4-cyclodiphosphate synthase [Neisseria sp. 3986]MDD9324863.1 2-C-methyl-D-erythritol 2,4-cyclodiphosphate synthase [Neisseria sp. 3986]
MNIRIGQGYDVHQLVPGRPLILGGVAIPFDKGLLGHSDADALLHALTDALLGAAALGDIGKLFPDTAAENKDADSRVLLRTAYQAVRRAGWQVVNVDSTVIAQQPKLRPHIDAMRANIAADLGLPVEAVNIKGKTNEKLGYLGRCEAIEAQAVVLLAADTARLFQDQTAWKTA